MTASNIYPPVTSLMPSWKKIRQFLHHFTGKFKTSNPAHEEKPSLEESVPSRCLTLCMNAQWSQVKEVLCSENFREQPAEVRMQILNSVLSEASHAGHLPTVRLVLTSRNLPEHAQVNHQDHLGHSALMTACTYGHLKVAKYLLTSKEILKAGGEHADLHQGGDLCLIWACAQNHLEVVKLLLNRSYLNRFGHAPVDIHVQNDLPLQYACSYGHLELVQYLLSATKLEEKAVVDPENPKALLHATLNGHLEVVKYILTVVLAGQDVNCVQSLLAAHEKGHVAIVNFLLFDYSMDFSEELAQHEELKGLFEKRALHSNLHNQLSLKPASNRNKL